MDDKTVREQLLDAVAQVEESSFDSLSAEIAALEATHELLHDRFTAAGDSDH